MISKLIDQVIASSNLNSGTSFIICDDFNVKFEKILERNWNNVNFQSMQDMFRERSSLDFFIHGRGSGDSTACAKIKDICSSHEDSYHYFNEESRYRLVISDEIVSNIKEVFPKKHMPSKCELHFA
jgi:hypothetical protein